jgi:glucan phosphoethanolaminetransferase (alkaline phosphatase superfamily)
MYLINFIQGIIALFMFRSKKSSMNTDQIRLLQKIYRSSFGPFLLIVGALFLSVLVRFILRDTDGILEKIFSTGVLLAAMYSLIWSIVAIFTVTINISKLNNTLK